MLTVIASNTNPNIVNPTAAKIWKCIIKARTVNSDVKLESPKARTQYAKIGAALKDAEAQGVNLLALSAIRVLALTGCRRNEILKLQHSEIDFGSGCFRYQDTKAGKQIRPVGEKALDVLKELDRTSDNWVFPASRGEGHMVNGRKTMMKVVEIAGLSDDITPHVLRHSFATTAHELGFTELTIAGLIGHSVGSVTARYVHHVDSALLSAADRVSAEIAHRLNLVNID
jgi:integrase